MVGAFFLFSNFKEMKAIRFFMVLLSATLLCGCNSDDDNNNSVQNVPQGLIGTWGGSKTISSTGSERSLIVTFKTDMTGDLTYESSSYYRYAAFNYTVSGNTINCYGVMVGEDGNVDDNWSMTFEYYETYILPIGAYSGITLYPAWNGSGAYDDNTASGGGTSGGSSSGSGNNSSYHVSFTNDWASIYSKGTYTHQIFMLFGVSKGTYALGYNSFGVAVRAKDGTIINSSAKTRKINGVSMTCFEEPLYSGDKDYDWGELLFVESKNKTIQLEYIPYFYDNNARDYVYLSTQTYTYTPKEVTNM